MSRHRSHSVQNAIDNPHLSSSIIDLSAKKELLNPARAEFQKRCRRYYYQITVGCGEQPCLHRMCASSLNGPSFVPELAGAIAMQLASNSRSPICNRIPQEPQIDIQFSPFGSPNGSVASSRSHSRQGSNSPLGIHLQFQDSNVIGNQSFEIGHSRKLSQVPMDQFGGRSRQTSNSLGGFRSRQGSNQSQQTGSSERSSTQKVFAELDAVPKPFLQSLFSYPSFSAIFGDSSSIPSSSQPSKCLDLKTTPFERLKNEQGTPFLKSKSMNDLVVTQMTTLQIPEQSIPKLSSQSSTTGNPSETYGEGEHISLKMLDWDLLQIAVESYYSLIEKGDFDHTFLLNVIGSVFSSQTAMSLSFLSKGEKEHPSNLDIPSIAKSYQLLINLQPCSAFQKSLTHSTEILLSKLYVRASSNRNQDLAFLRVLMILVLNPLLDDADLNETMTKKLCCVFGRLGLISSNLLTEWFAKLDSDKFTKILNLFKRAVLVNGVTSAIPEEAFVGAVKGIAIFSHANNLHTHPIVPLSHFYILELGTLLNFKDEFKKWKEGKVFAIFDYPFLLDPISKARILHIDAMVQMSLEYEDAYVNQALVLHAQRFLDDSNAMKDFETHMKENVNPYLVLEVRRAHLVVDVLDQISKKSVDLKKPLKVRFVGGGEEGMDQGGVQKEFFQVLMADLMDPNVGLFEYDPDTRLSWINRASMESAIQYELVGVILGLALYNGVIIRVGFPYIVYKKLLNEPIGLEDVEIGFPALGRGLRQLLDWSSDDVEDVFMRTFEISYESFGIVKHIPLIPGGDEIMVTNDNRKEYVRLYVLHFTTTSIATFFDALQKGFYKVCGGKSLAMCRPLELELLICGTSANELEFHKLEEGAGYDDGYSTEHICIKWFWEIVHAMDINHKRKLLEFVTASDRVPLKGLESLIFVIQRNGPDTDRLPTALTCFGRLLLPEYSSMDKMKERLVTAIENAKGFGLV